MSALRRLARRAVRWAAPFHQLWLAEKKISADLRAEVATLTAERDRARLIATTLEDELEAEWAEGDAFLRSLGERGA